MENNHIKNGVSYQEWKDNYLEPTFKNIKRYLVDKGYFILNINDFDKYELVKDSIEIAEKVGFSLIREHTLENISRINSIGELNDNNEKMLVFMKKGFESDYFVNKQVSFFDM